MFFYEGISCPHCSQTFKESDDIVACPVCGAPHHRDCWKDCGGCACADQHGTDEEWSRDTARTTKEPPVVVPATPVQAAQNDSVRCPQCGSENSPYVEHCSHCGAPMQAQDWHSPERPPLPTLPPLPTQPPQPSYQTPPTGNFHEYTPYHSHVPPCGGVNPNAEIEGETAKDLAAVVRTNTTYYLPRFEQMAKTGNKVSWNWAAFLFSPYWLLFRKQYSAGILVLAFDTIITVASNFLALTFFPTVLKETGYIAMYEEMMWLLQTDERAATAMYIVSLLSLATLSVRLFVALFGNNLYMKRCLRTVSKARAAYPEGYSAQLAMTGGTSVALCIVGCLCTYLIPNFILTLLL